MGDEIAPVPTNETVWKQQQDGWWAINGHPVLRIDQDSGMIRVAKMCPWYVDIPMQWAGEQLKSTGHEPAAKVEIPTPEWEWAKMSWGERVSYVFAIIIALLFLLFCILPILVEIGVVSIP